MFNLFLRERETEHEWGRGREQDTESEAGSRLWAVSTEPDTGLELTSGEIMAWAEVGYSTDWATQALLHCFFFIQYNYVPSRFIFFPRPGMTSLSKKC